MTLPEQEPFLTPFPSPSSTSRLLPQATQVFRGLSWKIKTCCLMLKVNTPLSCATTPHKPSPWGTDSSLWPLSQEGFRTVNSHTESNIGTFSHFPSDHTPLLVEASCTQQQGAPQLTPRSPSGHTPGPGPSPLRAEHLPPQPRSQPISALRKGRTQESWCSARDPDCNHLGHLKHYQAVDQHKLPEGESLVRGYKTWVCKMPNQWNLKLGLSTTQRRQESWCSVRDTDWNHLAHLKYTNIHKMCTGVIDGFCTSHLYDLSNFWIYYILKPQKLHLKLISHIQSPQHSTGSSSHPYLHI